MRAIENRRQFLRDCTFAGAGVLAAAVASNWLTQLAEFPVIADESPSKMDFEQRLRELQIVLPSPAKPIATYISAVATGNLLYTAGHIPRNPDGTLVQGRIGAELDVSAGAAAARLVGLHVLTTIRDKLGTLNRVTRLVKVLGMVNCTSDFTQQPKVIDGFSQLMVEVFGNEAGVGSRSSIGVNSLPSNVPVEIEAIFEIRAAR